MFLSNLKLKNFRNYNSLEINFSPRVNIFFGQNAQGKTNILEAIAFLGLGRSFRTRKEEEMIQWDSEVSFLSGFFMKDIIEYHIEIGIGHQEKRFKMNGQHVKNSQLFGQVPILIFAPDDLQIVKGGPQNRRDFMDFYLAQIDPNYRFIYYNFHKVLQHRNHLLKSNIHNQSELEIWDQQLVEKGTKVIKSRLQMLHAVQPMIIQAQQQISGCQEDLCLQYFGLNNQLLDDDNENDLQEKFKEQLQSVRRLEIDRQITLIGPHRDDLRIVIGTKVELRNFGSQGQQRTAVLALKLGLIEKIHESRGEFPILLLDDVMSEFDDHRKQMLLELLISSAQTFLTSTSARDFPISRTDSFFFEVVQGAVCHVL